MAQVRNVKFQINFVLTVQIPAQAWLRNKNSSFQKKSIFQTLFSFCRIRQRVFSLLIKQPGEQ